MKNTKKKLKGLSRVVKYLFSGNNITKVFFQVDSGFFKGNLFDLLESFGWDYLIKVKLKNLLVLLKKQKCKVIDNQWRIAACEFAVQNRLMESNKNIESNMYSKRVYFEADFFGEIKRALISQYAC